MIAIPNMSKPKSCAECELWSNCFYPKAPKEIDNKVMPDCPLIEIVRCGKCMHYTDHDCPIDWESLTVNDFCSYGERRTDE